MEKMRETHSSICRLCANECPVYVETVDGRVVGVTGVRENPVYRGYTCTKGRSHWTMYDHPGRLLHSLKRMPDGSFARIPVEDAISEIADQLRLIHDRHGPRAIAMFSGTYFIQNNPINMSLGDAFMKALESPMAFSPATIDQPGKVVAKGLHGVWMAPGQAMSEPDVALLVGTNPLVSHQGRAGHPGDFIKRLARRNAKLIVVDPRRTETAKRASVHIQPRPGEDITILAGLIRIIIEEHLYDAEFIAENAVGLDELRSAVEPFTPVYVARRADINAGELISAARIFGTARRGFATAGTGPNMTGRGTLVEYLLLCLDTACGHWLRAGERVGNALTVVPKAAQMSKAQALPPFPAYGYGEKLRVRGLAGCLAGLPASALADEIMLPGDGQVKALLSLGGNPLNAIPDQLNNIEAFGSLDLLVQTDVQMSPTAKMAHYIIACKLPYEMAGTTLMADFCSLYANGWGYEEAYGQYTPAIVSPPEGADVIEQWELLYGIAQRMGLQLDVFPGIGELLAAGSPTSLDMTMKPSIEELLALVHDGSRIPLDEVKRHRNGALFPEPEVFVEPKEPGWEGRLDLGNDDMMSDLRAVAREAPEPMPAQFPFRLISRRMMHITNSPTIAMPKGRRPYNPAFLNSRDMTELGLSPGDVIVIQSARAQILAVVEPDETVREKTVSISHSFGDTPEFDEDVRTIGSNPGRLVANDLVYDRYSGQPRMSNVPVQILRYDRADECR